jgi:hypothetical protein
VAKGCRNGKAASNWIMTEVMREMKGRASADGECLIRVSWPITPGAARRTHPFWSTKDAINGKTAKDVFARMWTSGESPQAIVEREGLSQVSDTGAIEAAIHRGHRRIAGAGGHLQEGPHQHHRLVRGPGHEEDRRPRQPEDGERPRESGA